MPFDEEDMRTLNLKSTSLAAASLMLMLSACIITPNADDDGPGYCPDENRVLVDGHKYCVMNQMIIEKGFDCPPDLSYRHDIPGTNGVACSDLPMLPPGDEDPLRDLILNPPDNNDPWLNNDPEPGNNVSPNNTTPNNVSPNNTSPNNTAMGCSTPDPSAQECASDADCGSGEICGVSAAQVCVPSSCFCDEETGTWGCTADCGQRRECIDNSASACGPDPSQQECDVDADCGDGQACVESDAQVCVPSTCFCDEETGTWGCTEDCNAPRQCADVADTCNGTPDPSEQECEADSDCADGKVCKPTGDDACVPSSCFCDPAGGWGCTDDCNPVLGCVDPGTGPDICDGMNDPSYQECQQDADCGSGEVCGFSATTECVPSTCSCDEEGGGWICTADCGQRRLCVPDEDAACGPNPSQHECDTDADCPDPGSVCEILDANVCTPSVCECDSSTGSWTCTTDCKPVRGCSMP